MNTLAKCEVILTEAGVCIIGMLVQSWYKIQKYISTAVV